MEPSIIWVLFSLVAGGIAGNKGRSGIGFFFLSLILSPVIGVLAAVLAKPNLENLDYERLASGTDKVCPFCAELIKKQARVCRYCGRDQIVAAISQPGEKLAAQEPASQFVSHGLPFLFVMALILFVLMVLSTHRL
jgi:hypothetical protein